MTDHGRIQRSISLILAFSIACIPLFFLPVTQDYFDTNKWMLLVVTVLLVVAVRMYSGLKKSSYELSVSPQMIGLGALTCASVISLCISSPNKVEALLAPLGPVTLGALTLIVLLTPALFDVALRRRFLWLLYGSGAILSLISVYQFFGMGKIMFPAVTYLSDPLWTPTGSTTATLAIALIILPLMIAHGVEAWKTKNELHLGLLSLLSIVTVAGAVLTAVQLVPRISSTLSVRDGWVIMLEILKYPKEAFLGVGAENFLAAFTAGRSALMNMTAIWNMRFATNATVFFHIITIYGLLGGAAFILFAKSFLPHQKTAFNVSLVAGLISLFIIPPNLSVLVVLVAILILSQDPKYMKTLKIPHQSLWLRIGIAIVTILAIGASSYFVIRSYSAELMFFRSLRKAQENNGTATYNLQIDAMKKNPYIARFHIIFSQTNLALATSLATSITSAGPVSDKTKEDQTKDRELIAQLIEQSIREAKIAINLNVYNIVAWENLANTYQQLIDVAQGADNWTVTSFQEAIRRDPTNPILHLELGSVYTRLQKYTEAITQLQQAVSLKPDYANAYYNLSNAYKLNKDSTQAIKAMEQAAALVDKQSNDYAIIAKELDALRSNAPTVKTATPATIVIPPLTLPSNAGPGRTP
jgi:tetratricopeptide (TPR) repeat protein